MDGEKLMEAMRAAFLRDLYQTWPNGQVPLALISNSPWRAALAAIEAEGFAVLPKEPTEAMHAAANREWDGRMSARSAGVWQAMIAAAPKP